ncbi:hypothetical protein EON80_03140 [bacterium]|nr:MAG: hypothetical protein EON80_03140 [bacterium]
MVDETFLDLVEYADTVFATGTSEQRFFFSRLDFGVYDPTGDTPENQKFPFTTLVNSDTHDTASNLGRPDVFRLNIGVSKETFQALFGTGKFEDIKGDFDFTALDTVMPHPDYGMMYWICILNPSEASSEKVMGWLAEAYEKAVKALPGTRG